MQKSGSDHFLALFAQSFDADPDDIAGLEETRRLHAQADTGRRAGADHITRQECHEMRDVADQMCDREDHVGRVAVLAPLAMLWFWPRGESAKPDA
jgi:hypothetical protein